MSKNRNNRNRYSSNQVASAALIARNRFMYKWEAITEALAMSRFQWNGLPETVDERFLERTLLRYGQAVIFKGPTDEILATQVQGTGQWDLYHNPTKLKAIADNGWTYDIPEGDGVVIYESQTRRRKWDILSGICLDLAEIDELARVNRKQQKTLITFSGPEENSADLAHLVRDLEMNESSRIVHKSFSEDVEIKAINTGIPYLQKEYHEDRTATLNELYQHLGIEYIPFEKGERLVSAEASAAHDSVARMREDAIQARQDAADKFNKIAGTNITIEWRTQQQEELGYISEDPQQVKEGEEK